MIDSLVLQTAASLGVGGFLGTLIFIMYRKDRCKSEEMIRQDRKFMEDRLTRLLEDDYRSREENTRALTELTTLISRLNGKLSK